jgi:hypothetical protein
LRQKVDSLARKNLSSGNDRKGWNKRNDLLLGLEGLNLFIPEHQILQQIQRYLLLKINFKKIKDVIYHVAAGSCSNGD